MKAAQKLCLTILYAASELSVELPGQAYHADLQGGEEAEAGAHSEGAEGASGAIPCVKQLDDP